MRWLRVDGDVPPSCHAPVLVEVGKHLMMSALWIANGYPSQVLNSWGNLAAMKSRDWVSVHSLYSYSGCKSWHDRWAACHSTGTFSSFQVWWMILGIRGGPTAELLVMT